MLISDDLEKIPPLYLNILTKLGPFIKQVALFTDILTWKDPSRSIIAVFLWVTFCTWTQRWLIFGLPCLYLVKLGVNWLTTQMIRRRRETREQHIKDNLSKKKTEQQDLYISRGIRPVKDITLEDTLQHLQTIQAWWTHCHWRSLWSYATQPHNTTIVHGLLIYAWPVWAVINLALGPQGIFALVGTWLLVSCSPWYQIMMLALKKNAILYHYTRAFVDYNIALLTYSSGKSERTKHKKLSAKMSTSLSLVSPPLTPSTSSSSYSSAVAKETYRCEVSFVFEVLENQRWWLGLDWTTNMLRSEREAWTDNQLRPIVSKEEYKLPEDKMEHSSRDDNRMTVKSWVWNDRDWWVDMTGELENLVDRNGWQYSDNGWQNTVGVPGPHCFTRQRKWCRRAKLIERQLIV